MMTRMPRKKKPIIINDFASPNNEPQFKPLNEAQARLWQVMKDNTIVFVLGPAGTAKTHCSVAWSTNAVEKGAYDRIVMTRPIIEATESLGFLPGGVVSKVQPYMRPMMDVMTKVKPKTPMIDTIPLAYMRGITLENCIGLLDEAQNCNEKQLKLYLTRLGHNAKMIISGDTDQVDVNDSGLLTVANKLKGIPGVAVFEFTLADSVRHPLVRVILEHI